ncbi:hypothetical protein [Elizabethkingia anophelis]|uniref:Uncharacterized protein n=1 Tax=Elizabethkingia anophelis R26 TaxID=1246994 RepID=A0ABN5BUT1_9FLAO|nr:hypothetical protein [Elizabethkingia anophelis]ATC35566.1 hypothetical protein BAZ09_004775 [Elizabethkingia anophelis R26]ATC39204.1 hypothetical protein EAAG1_004775 [Elizabethkingia anophelis Ag1]ATC42885.1 hypothetical protein CMV41_04775 [Elizabethkingia anophelis]ATC46561.1 hypothetical protein CMV40_04775 [Elizabethkingia anophelis]ELR78611.1 hypothetical protein D505_12410 [Elizabethkingia anophelis R26]
MKEMEIVSIDEIQILYSEYKMRSDKYFNKRFIIVLVLLVAIFILPYFLAKNEVTFPKGLDIIMKIVCFIMLFHLLFKKNWATYMNWISILIIGINSICERNNIESYKTFTPNEKELTGFLYEVTNGNINVIEQDKIFAKDLLEFYRDRSKFINFLG